MPGKDWFCDVCQTRNFARRKVCFECNKGTQGTGGDGEEEKEWEFTGGKDDANREKASGEREEGWHCSTCKCQHSVEWKVCPIDPQSKKPTKAAPPNKTWKSEGENTRGQDRKGGKSPKGQGKNQNQSGYQGRWASNGWQDRGGGGWGGGSSWNQNQGWQGNKSGHWQDRDPANSGGGGQGRWGGGGTGFQAAERPHLSPGGDRGEKRKAAWLPKERSEEPEAGSGSGGGGDSNMVKCGCGRKVHSREMGKTYQLSGNTRKKDDRCSYCIADYQRETYEQQMEEVIHNTVSCVNKFDNWGECEPVNAAMADLFRALCEQFHLEPPDDLPPGTSEE